MRKRIFAHPAANTILNMAGICEQSYQWKDSETGEICKSRPDFHTADNSLLVDLKTTEDASMFGFQKSIHSFRYHVQAAWYLRSLAEAEQFVFIAVEKKPPYLVAVYNASKEMVEAGNRAADKNLALLAECRKSNKWVGYSDIQQEGLGFYRLHDYQLQPFLLKRYKQQLSMEVFSQQL
jgi:exodeoxyribonuclease VIII